MTEIKLLDRSIKETNSIYVSISNCHNLFLSLSLPFSLPLSLPLLLEPLLVEVTVTDGIIELSVVGIGMGKG